MAHNEASGSIDPHLSNLPGEVKLTSLVSTHISNMSSSSSPGFDTVLPPFIKHACNLVPRQHGRGFENYNVLAPYISQLFTLMLTTARIPSSWKAATWQNCTHWHCMWHIQKGRCDTSFKLPDACSQ
eukprot:506600-Pelagomonas_calceolata.AAC.1